MKVRTAFRAARLFVGLCGVILIAALVLACTDVPWSWYGWMADPGPEDPGPPDFIVMMGGGGVPSESGLMRTWKTAEAGRVFPAAMIVIALPGDETGPDHRAIERELTMRGVAGSRLLRETNGRNTHQQALEVFGMLSSRPGGRGACVALVTSPEHMRRTWMSFRKAGFDRLISLPSWPTAIEADTAYGRDGVEGSGAAAVVGGSMTLRYRFWDNLGIMIRCLRETAGLAYYRLAGWI